MARLQILELPEGTGDDRPPFILVIDEVAFDNPVYERFVADEELATGLASRVGARAVLVFEDTIDIPANDLTLTHVQEAADGNVIRLRVEPDLEGFTETVMTEVAKAQAEVMDARRGERR
ncbi:hypothetical protein ACH43Y_13945 [Streptomyces rubiginosohelvolus]|uniref:hypothetical protein n=1 Tax=Streptomyces rubiginosohelvolus TaxID=67362 RepID=UPI00378A99C4